MPRNNDVYSPPSGTGGTPQTPINSAMFNAYVADMTTDANNPRPIVAGGTGAATAQGAIDNFFSAARTIEADKFTLVDPSDNTKIVRLDAGNVTAGQTWPAFVGKGTDVASASTVTLGAGNFFHITGTTTITDIDFTEAYDGRWAVLEFDGALTLTHNATTLVIPGAADIVTAAGDRAFIVQDSSGNIHVLFYQRAAVAPARKQAWEEIASGAISNVAALSFPNLSAYRKLRLRARIVPATDNATIGALVSVDNGASWLTGGVDYSYQFIRSTITTSTAVSGSSAFLVLATSGVGNLAGEGFAATLELDEFNQAAVAFGTVQSVSKDNTGVAAVSSIGVFALGTTARDGLRIIASSGDLASGSYVLEGWRG